MKSASEDIKKSSRGRPRADTEPVMVRIAPDLLEALDTYRRAESDMPTRPEAIRRALSEWLREKGHLK